MGNNIYHDMALANIRSAMDFAKSVSTMKHPGEKGTAREIFLKNLLQPYLIQKIGISSGVIINPDGEQSNQVDIILYNKEILPPIVFTEGRGIVPCEAVLATIEVKSKLTTEALKDAINNGKSIKKVGIGSTETSVPQVISTPAFLFAFESQWSKPETLKKNLVNTVARVNDESGEIYYLPISGICVPDVAFIVGQYKNEETEWITIKDKGYLETLAFISFITKVCRKVSEQRLGGYIGVYLHGDKLELA